MARKLEGFDWTQPTGRYRFQRSERKLPDDLLAKVADAYRNAPRRGRQAAVAELLGVDTHRASWYISRARQAGLLSPVTGDMRVVDDA